MGQIDRPARINRGAVDSQCTETLCGRFERSIHIDSTDASIAGPLLAGMLRASVASYTEAHLSRVTCVPFDQSAAATLDRVRDKTSLRKIGRADLLVASIAVSRRASPATRNR